MLECGPVPATAGAYNMPGSEARSEGSGEGLPGTDEGRDYKIIKKATTTCMACMKCIIPRVSCNLFKYSTYIHTYACQFYVDEFFNEKDGRPF